MAIKSNAFITAGIIAGAIGLASVSAQALPSLGANGVEPGHTSPKVDKVYCGYYGCYRRPYYYGGYYRPYYRPYYYGGYYRPYYNPYYGPHVGIGIGGIGIY